MSVYNIDGSALLAVYNVSGSSVSSAYDISENIVFNISNSGLDYTSYTTTDLFTFVKNGFNGFDVYGNYIAQLWANNKLYLFDLSDYSTIASAISITCSHGDSATFSNEFYSSDDTLPLLYCTADTTPALIYVNRITNLSSYSSATLVKTLAFPSSAGYYGAGAFDWDNNICYLLAYKEQNYLTDNSGSNTTVVSSWDLSNLTDNGDDTYTPAYINQYERDFIYVMQGLQFFDGYVWVASGYNTGGNQYIYAMNPSNGVIEYTITLDDTIEIEGLSWVYDDTEEKYWMLVGQQNGSEGINYSRIDFASIS